MGDRPKAGHDADLSASVMEPDSGMEEPVDLDLIVASRRATTVSRELIQRAKATAERAERRLEHARNLLQALWLQRELLRRQRAARL